MTEITLQQEYNALLLKRLKEMGMKLPVFGIISRKPLLVRVSLGNVFWDGVVEICMKGGKCGKVPDYGTIVSN